MNGERNNPLASFERTLKQLEAAGVEDAIRHQRLSTPLNEQGVVFTPDDAPPKTMLPGIQRVWSLNWLRYGMGLRMQQGDQWGHVITRPPVWEQVKEVTKTDSCAGGAGVYTLNFEEVVDHVHLMIYNAEGMVTFSMDDATYYHQRHIQSEENTISAFYSADHWIRCQYVKCDLNAVTAHDGIIAIGSVFPEL